MSFNTDFLQKTGNRILSSDPGGKYHIVEYARDISVSPATAQTAYFSAQMGFRKRQLAVILRGDDVVIQAGAMQWFGGNVNVKTDVKGIGDLAGKLFNSAVTKETAVKPRYAGDGIVVLEPTYKYLLVEDLNNWEGGLVVEDGLFLACDGSTNIRTVARSNISSAALGGEGFFNSCLVGNGKVVLESYVPREELVTLSLDNDTVKIDGSFAIAWSASLQFTVERTTKTLIGSAASGEGLVNVYRGTGRILMAPIA